MYSAHTRHSDNTQRASTLSDLSLDDGDNKKRLAPNSKIVTREKSARCSFFTLQNS